MSVYESDIFILLSLTTDYSTDADYIGRYYNTFTYQTNRFPRHPPNRKRQSIWHLIIVIYIFFVVCS